jgi:hypothetical protein
LKSKGKCFAPANRQLNTAKPYQILESGNFLPPNPGRAKRTLSKNISAYQHNQGKQHRTAARMTMVYTLK